MACPNPQQEPLAEQLVKAGADIVVGSGAHVLQGAGYLGTAYVEYGLGNLAFYDDTAPETDSGTLLLTVEGRHILGFTFRPATIVNGLPQPLTRRTGGQRHTELAGRTQLHQPFGRPDGFPGLREGGDHSLRPPTTTTTIAPATTTTTAAERDGPEATTTTTTAKPTVTQPTDNAG